MTNFITVYEYENHMVKLNSRKTGSEKPSIFITLIHKIILNVTEIAAIKVGQKVMYKGQQKAMQHPTYGFCTHKDYDIVYDKLAIITTKQGREYVCDIDELEEMLSSADTTIISKIKE